MSCHLRKYKSVEKGMIIDKISEHYRFWGFSWMEDVNGF